MFLLRPSYVLQIKILLVFSISQHLSYTKKLLNLIHLLGIIY